MSKKGLPTTIRMRHDSHYVEEFAKTQRSIGRNIPIHLIAPNPDQPRVEIGDLTDLSGSIKEKGVLEPILVKPNAGSGTWMIIAGERRWRAATLAGLTEMPCVELDIDEKDIAEIALIENLQRKDLTVWEEVDGYAYLIDKFDYTHEEIAKKIGKSRTTITESLTIAGLPEQIRAKCRLKDITSKSALLEVARQFDEKAMHEFLDGNNKKTGKRSVPASQNAQIQKNFGGNTGAPEESTINAVDESHIFKFDSSAGNFKLEINFRKSGVYKNKDVLSALKEAYMQVKKVSQ